MKKSTYIFMLVFALLVVARALSQSVKTQSDVIAPEQKIVVTFSGFPKGNDGWIIVVAKGADAFSHITYAYTYGKEQGTVEFDAAAWSMRPGEYEIRGCCSAGYDVCARYFFRIGNDEKVSISTKKIIEVDEKILVDFSGFEGNQKDWISIADENSPDDKYLSYVYTEGKQRGQVTFDPRKPGVYEVRGYFNNDYKVRARFKFRVGNEDTHAKVWPQKNEFKVDDPIMIDFSGFPGNENDWIGIAKAGTNTNEYIEYKYTDKKYNGSLTFKSLPLGKYEVRGYFNGSYVVEAKDTFWVGEPYDPRVVARKLVYAPDENIVIDFSGFPGTNDWISLAAKGTPDNHGLQYWYTNYKQSGSLVFSKLPPGEYEARGYTDWPKTYLDLQSPTGNSESFVVRARTEFKVGNEDPEIRLITKPYYWSSEKITVQFSGFPGTEFDYITISQNDQELQRETTHGKQSGTLVFDNRPQGSYELKAFTNNDAVAKREVFASVYEKALDAYPEKINYSESEDVTIKFENFPGNDYDVITIHKTDLGNLKFIGQQYLRGKKNGELKFHQLQSGAYEVSGYVSGDPNCKVRHKFYVGEPFGKLLFWTDKFEFAAGEKIKVNIENYSGSSRYTIAVASLKTEREDNIRYESFEGAEKSFHVELAGLPPGLYELRLYSFGEDKIIASIPIKVS